MSSSYKDLKTEFGSVAECLQESESLIFLRCSEVRDETVAVMQIELNGEFRDVVCKQADLCELQDAVETMTDQPEQQAHYKEELHIAQKDLMGHERYRRG